MGFNWLENVTCSCLLVDIVPVFPIQEILGHDRCPWKECNYYKCPNLAKIQSFIAAENPGSYCDHPSLPFMVSQRNREQAWEWEGKAPGHISSCMWTCHFPPAGPCVGTRLSTLQFLKPAEAAEEPESLFQDREFIQRIPQFKGTENKKGGCRQSEKLLPSLLKIDLCILSLGVCLVTSVLP